MKHEEHRSPRGSDRRAGWRGRRAGCLASLSLTLACLSLLGVAAPPLASARSPASHPRSAERAAPACVAGDDARSMARAGGLLTVSPEPGTVDATPETQISIVGVPADDLSAVNVLGSATGPHPGELAPYSQGDGGSFLPREPFAEGEAVTVKLELHVGGESRVVGWRFTVGYKAGLAAANPKSIPAKSSKRRRARAASASTATSKRFLSDPGLQPPIVHVTVHARDDSPGFLFMSPFSPGRGQAGPMIIDDSGELVWFHPVNTGPTAATKATDLQVQAYEGRPVLTWWEDPLIPSGSGRRAPQDVIYSSSYERVASVRAGNGLVADVHEFQITPEGTAFIAVKHDVRCDLGGIGGKRDASVWDGVVQEVDIATGLVRWEWNSLDHVSLSEAEDSVAHATASYPFDFFHLNSIETVAGDALLLSARNTWAMYDIDRKSGLIRWRLGGRHSSFAMGAGTRTAWQHDARVIGYPGKRQIEISVFDDGATPKVHRQSRALVELIDLDAKTVRLVHAFTNSPPLLAGSQGSVQLTPGGETVVGWGQEPWVTEFSPEGQILFDAHLPKADQSYRALRFEWQGTPPWPPSVAAQALGAGRLAIYVSWNGATEVANWRVLEGVTSATLTAAVTAPKTGFETKITAPAAGPLVIVQALDSAGEVIGTSNVVNS